MDYKDRKVARYETGELFVSTAFVDDGFAPFETAVAAPEYNQGSMVIVESYETREEAMAGHERWVGKMLTNPPRVLVDVGNNALAALGAMVDGVTVYERGVTS